MQKARERYEQISARLADRLGGELALVFRTISENPLIYQIVYKGIRRAITFRFPYAVYYVVEGNRVSVLRVLDQRGNPSEWQQ
jgi:plasmid stabilization system protein ParE